MTREAAEGGTDMAQVTKIGRVLVPVADQDEAIAFYTRVLGFTLTADVPFAGDSRWVEVTPPGGGAAVALVPPQGEYQPGRMTGISLGSPDPRAVHAELAGKGVDVDAEIVGGGGDVPVLFFFRDHDKNQLMIVQELPPGGADDHGPGAAAGASLAPRSRGTARRAQSAGTVGGR
jgi:catechol 2,3-dioxygenase-like lactoylglutathione lyase family enzyme